MVSRGNAVCVIPKQPAICSSVRRSAELRNIEVSRSAVALALERIREHGDSTSDKKMQAMAGKPLRFSALPALADLCRAFVRVVAFAGK